VAHPQGSLGFNEPARTSNHCAKTRDHNAELTQDCHAFLIWNILNTSLYFNSLPQRPYRSFNPGRHWEVPFSPMPRRTLFSKSWICASLNTAEYSAAARGVRHQTLQSISMPDQLPVSAICSHPCAPVASNFVPYNGRWALAVKKPCVTDQW